MPLQHESVWDYPRPPRLEAVPQVLCVRVGDHVIAETLKGYRILETSHPPTYYIPLDDIDKSLLIELSYQTYCEFKGWATYWALKLPNLDQRKVAWSYADPSAAYLTIRDFLSFYALPGLTCTVDDVEVVPQEGAFYGGWITPNLQGPIKGAPGTEFW